jgi:CheY-like chemotaxis protein/HPt (histidine-containing phosphotransfer) domain-containing protein
VPEAVVRALVVDDQANVRLLLSHILRNKIGCAVSEATNGLEALELLGRHQFDLVVLDVMMPMMDGIEMLETMRRRPSLRHLPVIVLSAVRDEGKVRQLVRHGISGYLAKPLRPLDVAERIQQIIARITAAHARPSRSLPALPHDDPAPQDIVSARADLRSEMISATEQVFGMMLGIEVLALPGDRPAMVGDDVVRVALRLAREDCDLEFLIAAPRSMSERMTAQYLQASDVIADEDVASTLGKIAIIISSRLQSTLRQRGDDVTLGHPCVSRIGPADEDTAGLMRVTYASSARDLRFITTLRAVPVARTAVASPEVTAVISRTSRMDTTQPQPLPVDPEVLEMLASLQEPGEPDLLVELVTLFLRDTPERLQFLVGQPLDANHVARVAHAVKGSAGNLGAMVLQDCASALEQAAQRGEGADVLTILADAVRAEYGRVERFLQQILAQRRGTTATDGGA